AGGRPPVALMAGGAAKFIGIMCAQKFRVGMAGESPGILIRMLLALASHDRSRDPKRLAGVHVAGLAAVHDIGIRNVDLNDLGVPLFGFLLQTVNLGG